MALAYVANKNWLVLQRMHTESVHRDKIRKFSHQYTPEGAADLVWLRNTAGLIIKFWPKLESPNNQLLPQHEHAAQIKAKISGANHDEKSSRKKVMRLDCFEIQSNGDTLEVRYCVKRSPLKKMRVSRHPILRSVGSRFLLVKPVASLTPILTSEVESSGL